MGPAANKTNVPGSVLTRRCPEILSSGASQNQCAQLGAMGPWASFFSPEFNLFSLKINTEVSSNAKMSGTTHKIRQEK